MILSRGDDPEPAIVRRRGAGAPFVFICDHAGRATPRSLGDLGVAPADWARHIAWDIGAAALTERLSAELDAPAVLQPYSRLVIDCNRDPDRADAIPERSDGTDVPGNVGLPAEARAARVAEVHAPYHDAISALLDARAGRELPTALVFVHSFTPRMAGVDRPWRYGVLHLGGSPLSDAALAVLRGADVGPVGDNAPYRMDVTDHSAPRHAVARGLDYLELEVRQDLIADAAGVDEVAALLLRVLPQAAALAGVTKPTQVTRTG